MKSEDEIKFEMFSDKIWESWREIYSDEKVRKTNNIYFKLYIYTYTNYHTTKTRLTYRK